MQSLSHISEIQMLIGLPCMDVINLDLLARGRLDDDLPYSVSSWLGAAVLLGLGRKSLRGCGITQRQIPGSDFKFST